MAKKKPVKTNAMRLLDEMNIDYEHLDLNLKEACSAEEIAAMTSREPETIFKTLVTVGSDKNHYVFMVPANGHLALKKAARAAGVKSVEMIHQKELFPLTGYVHGGCSPLGMKKSFPTFIDESCILHDTICFSGGKIGVQIELDPQILIDRLSVSPVDLVE